MIKNNLSDKNSFALFCALPMRYGEDSEAIDAILEKLGIDELSDENFQDILSRVRTELSLNCAPPAPPMW